MSSRQRDLLDPSRVAESEMSENIMVEAQERAASLFTSSSPAHSFFVDMDEPASGPCTPTAFNGILPPSNPVRLATPLANTSDDDDKYDDAVDIQEPSRHEEPKEEASFALSTPPLDADRTLIQQEPPANTKEQRPEALTLPASPPLPQQRSTGFEPIVRDKDHNATPREDLLTPQLEANLTLLSQHDQLRQQFLAFANDAECAVRSKDRAVLQATVNELSLRVRKVSAILVSLTAQLNEMSAQGVEKDLGQAQRRLKAEHNRIFSDAASRQQQPNVVIKDGLMLLDMLLRHLGELAAETEKQLAKATEMVRSPRLQNTGIS